MTGPRLVVAVVAAAVLLGAVVPAVPAVVSEDGEEFVDVIQGVGTVDVDGGERDDDTAGELSAESDANGSSDSPGEPSRVGDGRVIFEDGETGSSEYVRSVRAYRNGTLEVTLHPDHDTDGFSVMHEYHSDPGEDALFLGENPSFAGPIRVPMLDYVLDEAYPTGTFRLEIREGVTGGEWHLPTLVVRDDVVESITFTIPETWQHANELVDDEFSVYGYTPTDLDGNAVARHVAEEINDRREAEGLGALESHADIAGAADAVAETWARRDNAPGGGVYRPSPSEVEIESQDCASPVLATAVRVDRPAITPDGAAQLETPEDVAAAVVDIWMVKPETRSRLLRERLQSHGVGVDVQNGKVYVTHLRCESLRYSL